MVQEDTTRWDPFFKTNTTASGFEGASLLADGYTSNFDGTLDTKDTTVKLMGMQSLKMQNSGQHIRLSDGSGMASNAFQYAIDAAKMSPVEIWTDVYFRVYSRWNATSFTNSDYKYWWLQGGPFGYFVDLEGTPDFSAPPSIRITDPANWANWINANFPGGKLQNGHWYLIELHFRIQGSGNYVVQVWMDNQLVLDKAVASGVSPSPNGWGWETQTNAYDTLSSWVYNHWQDGFAVSHTRVGPASLIEISNCSTYGSGTKLYQAPEFLSDTSSQINVNLSSLGSGPYVLWVTNNQGQRSQPFSLGTGTPSCAQSRLPAPGNLTVQ